MTKSEQNRTKTERVEKLGNVKDCGVLPEADHCQPPQYTVKHPIFNAHNDLLSSRPTLMEQMEQLTSMCEMFFQFIQKKQKEKQIKEEETAKAQNSKIPVCYDDDDDYNSAITPNEPVDSLRMGDEHLNTILATESDEFIKSRVVTLVPNPSESEGKNGCDVPACFTTFSDILFDAEIESFSPSHIPNKDSDSFMEEINLSFNPDDLVPPGIEEDDDDSERDMLIHKELLDNYSLSLPVIESFYFDIPSFSRPLAKPPDGNT
nr:hypothetical protein [Tanacetum cinerariifolium]